MTQKKDNMCTNSILPRIQFFEYNHILMWPKFGARSTGTWGTYMTMCVWTNLNCEIRVVYCCRTTNYLSVHLAWFPYRVSTMSVYYKHWSSNSSTQYPQITPNLGRKEARGRVATMRPWVGGMPIFWQDLVWECPSAVEGWNQDTSEAILRWVI